MPDLYRFEFDTCQCGCGQIERYITDRGPYMLYSDHSEALRQADEKYKELEEKYTNALKTMHNMVYGPLDNDV